MTPLTTLQANPPNDDEIEDARRILARLDPALALTDTLVAPFSWRTRSGGYAGLARMIMEQQVSTVSAAATWGRLEAGLGAVTPETVEAADPVELRLYGLSRQKTRYIKALAEAHLQGSAAADRIAHLDDDAAISALTAVVGVGRWTAEVYLMMCEGRPDIFPAADIALQEALRLADGAALRPTERALRQRAELWRPWRSVACHLLWGLYLGVKDRSIVIPTQATEADGVNVLEPSSNPD